jgi:hypothetical protein
VSSPTRSHPIEEISFSGVESIDQHYLADLSEHINPIYAARQAKRAIQRQFAKDSAIELRQFLSSAGLSAFIKGISENYQSAQFRGPPNRRSYCTISASSIHRFFGSVEFREYLEQITGLKLREPLLNSVRSSPIEIRMFTPGSFTMINDNFLEPEGLDVTFYLISGEPGNDDDEMACGGNTVYIDGEDTLLVVEPAVNMLSIVYRRGQTQRFVEYLSTNYPGERLVDVSATFTVNNQ